MINSIVKLFREIIVVTTGLEIIAVVIFGIIMLQESFIIGLLIWIGGLVLVIVSNGIVCTYIKIEEHLDVLRTEYIKNTKSKNTPILWKCPKCGKDNPNDKYSCENCEYRLC